MDHLSNVAVIIRHCEERTLEYCKLLVSDQIDSDKIVVINEAPFSKAVRRTFEIGMDFNLPWTLAIDADILIKKGACREFILRAEKEDENVFSFNCKSLDKFFSYPRYGGPHLYRTSLLKYAIKNFPNQEYIRPESKIGEILNLKHNFSNINYEDVFCLHDYEQWYRDIYRKTFVHAKKMGKKQIESFIKYWTSNMRNDNDFKVAIAGLYHGLSSQERISIDIRSLPNNYRNNRILSDLEEKKPLDLNFLGIVTNNYNFVDNQFLLHINSNKTDIQIILSKKNIFLKYIELFFYLIKKLSETIIIFINKHQSTAETE